MRRKARKDKITRRRRLRLRRLLSLALLALVFTTASVPPEKAFDLHEKLIGAINAGDVLLAMEHVDRHMDEGLNRSYQVFQRRKLLQMNLD